MTHSDGCLSVTVEIQSIATVACEPLVEHIDSITSIAPPKIEVVEEYNPTDFELQCLTEAIVIAATPVDSIDLFTAIYCPIGIELCSFNLDFNLDYES